MEHRLDQAMKTGDTDTHHHSYFTFIISVLTPVYLLFQWKTQARTRTRQRNSWLDLEDSVHRGMCEVETRKKEACTICGQLGCRSAWTRAGAEGHWTV